MRLLNHTLPTLAENLALDEALFLAAEAGHMGECLRLWEWPEPAVVLGASGVFREEVFAEDCARDGVPVLRRASGGGTVLLGRGCLSYSLLLSMADRPELRQITASYCAIMGTMNRALQPLVPTGQVHCAGSSDLAWDGRKFSGNAQRRGRSFLLHHGTILYAFDLAFIPRYLPPPPRQPEYRAGRPHEEFVCNLPVDQAALGTALTTAWAAQETLATWPREQMATLTAQKYTQPEWIQRR